MISIAIINLKGGVGKSVTACNLAAELAAKSKSVLVVDLDKQGNTSKFFGVADYDRPCVSSVLLGVARARDTIVETAIPAVALLPCDMRMLKANRTILMDSGLRQYYLRDALETLDDSYDYYGYCPITVVTSADGSETETLGDGKITRAVVSYAGENDSDSSELWAGDRREQREAEH